MDEWLSLLLPDEPYVSIGDLEAIFFYFLLCSCAGWVLENVYNRALGETFWKEGFLQGPYKPMYGLTPVGILLLSGPKSGFWTVAFLCLTVPTLVEYVSGVILKGLFRHPYWDYSGFRYQLHGHICVPYSLCWLGLCLLFMYVLLPYAALLYELMAPVWQSLWFVLALLFVGDAVWTVGAFIRKNISASSDPLLPPQP